MIRMKNIFNKILILFLMLIILGLVGCFNSSNSSEITKYSVEISNLSTGIVLESKVDNVDELTSIRLSTSNPKSFENYYLVYKFRITTLEELKEDNKLFVLFGFQNGHYNISNGTMIQTYKIGKTSKVDLFRLSYDNSNIMTTVEIPKEENEYIDVTIAWKFFCDFDKLKYNLYFSSQQLDTDGSKLRISKILTTRKATYDKPKISFDEESNSIIWDTIPNVHHYKIYIDGEVLGCDPEREDSYPHIGKQNESGKECLYLSTLKSLGVSGKVKVKLLMEPHISDLANPVYSNTITVNVE